jgi:hypothetical protein
MTTNSFNKFNDINNNSGINANYNSFISPTLSLQNIKYFLESYKTSKKQSLFSEKFLKECPLYATESQIPDSFYKLHKPFDRNSAFYIGHGPYGSSRRNSNYSYKISKNYYPRCPLILSNSCDLISIVNKKNKKDNVNNVNKSAENIGEGEKDFMMTDLINKIWSMKLLNDNMICQYGPYSSKVMFQFLKNYYIPLNPQEQKKMNLLITDIMQDIYYQPDTLYQMLQDIFGKN